MKVGVISESPLLTTGYGVPTRHLCQRFHQSGMDVACLGIHQVAFGYHEHTLPYRVWPTCPHDENGLELMEYFLRGEQPDVLLLLNTLPVCNEWAALLRRKFKVMIPALAYFSAEGAPLSPDWFNTFRFVQKSVAWTEFTRQSAMDAYNVNTESVYMGVDHEAFQPYDDERRKTLRQAVGWDDRFVVLFVGRNMFAKQQDKMVEAASILRQEGHEDVLIHLQCKPFESYSNGGWDLPSLCRQWDVREMISFPPDMRNQAYATPHSRDPKSVNLSGDVLANLASLSLADRYNCADLYIHPSMVEGFSFPCAEAMACGVPIAHTDDNGVMNEVCGEAGYRIPRVAEMTVSWGSRYSVLSARDIADTIIRFRDKLRDNPEERKRLGGLGVKQSMRYNWDKTASSIMKMLEQTAAIRL